MGPCPARTLPGSPRGTTAVGSGGVGGRRSRRLSDGGEAEVLRRIAGRLAGLAERIDEAGRRAWAAAADSAGNGGIRVVHPRSAWCSACKLYGRAGEPDAELAFNGPVPPGMSPWPAASRRRQRPGNVTWR